MLLAISLTQPWCTLVARGIKPVENRSQLFSVLLGKTFGLHASMKWDDDGAAWIERTWSHDALVMDALRGEHRRGQIIGVARSRGYLQGKRYWDHAAQAWRSWDDVGPFEVGPARLPELALLDSAWYFGKDPNHKQKYGLVLDSQRAVARPVTCKGALGCWPVPPALEEDLAEQLGARPWEV